jgi:hypothetical protein
MFLRTGNQQGDMRCNARKARESDRSGRIVFNNRLSVNIFHKYEIDLDDIL